MAKSRWVLTFAVPLAAGTLLISATAEKDNTTSSETTTRESRRPRVRFGGLVVGVGYSHTSGYPYGGYGAPYGYGGPYGWGAAPYFAYDPFLFSPYFHPGFFRGFATGPGLGEVKLATQDKTAAVFIDGGFAGQAGKLKTLWLEPGAYNLELKAENQTSFTKRIYVLSGKTLRIEPKFAVAERQP